MHKLKAVRRETREKCVFRVFISKTGRSSTAAAAAAAAVEWEGNKVAVRLPSSRPPYAPSSQLHLHMKQHSNSPKKKGIEPKKQHCTRRRGRKKKVGGVLCIFSFFFKKNFDLNFCFLGPPPFSFFLY